MSLISPELMHDTEAGGHARPVPVFQSAQLAILLLPGTAFSTEVLVLCCRLSTDVDRFSVRRAVKADITGMCRVADACAASWSAQQLKVSSPLRCNLNCLLRKLERPPPPTATSLYGASSVLYPMLHCASAVLLFLILHNDCCACQALYAAGGGQHQLCSSYFQCGGQRELGVLLLCLPAVKLL